MSRPADGDTRSGVQQLTDRDVDRRSARLIAATTLDAFPRRRLSEPWLAADGAVETVLSHDESTGEFSSVVSLPPCPPGPRGSFAGSTEWFVIEGSLTIGGRSMGRFGFTCIPGGTVDGPVSSSTGCRVAIFGSGARRFTPYAQAPDGPVLPPVEHLDAYNLPWCDTAATLPGRLPPGLLVKPLMEDIQSGAITFLSGSLMRRTSREVWEHHPHFEEQLYLAGEFDQAEMLPGGRTAVRYSGPGYSFRPAAVSHLGPGCGTDSFCLRVVRVPRRMTNVYTERPQPYPPDYLDPVLVGSL